MRTLPPLPGGGDLVHGPRHLQPELHLLGLRGRGLPLPVRRRHPGARAEAASMSWAAHDLEPYVVQKHLGKKVAFMPLLLGSYAPDMFTKWFVYGVGFFGHEVKASNPAQFHRGWPGLRVHALAGLRRLPLARHLRRLAEAGDRLQLPDRPVGALADRHRRHRRHDAASSRSRRTCSRSERGRTRGSSAGRSTPAPTSAGSASSGT